MEVSKNCLINHNHHCNDRINQTSWVCFDKCGKIVYGISQRLKKSFELRKLEICTKRETVVRKFHFKYPDHLVVNDWFHFRANKTGDLLGFAISVTNGRFRERDCSLVFFLFNLQNKSLRQYYVFDENNVNANWCNMMDLLYSDFVGWIIMFDKSAGFTRMGSEYYRLVLTDDDSPATARLELLASTTTSLPITVFADNQQQRRMLLFSDKKPFDSVDVYDFEKKKFDNFMLSSNVNAVGPSYVLFGSNLESLYCVEYPYSVSSSNATVFKFEDESKCWTLQDQRLSLQANTAISGGLASTHFGVVFGTGVCVCNQTADLPVKDVSSFFDVFDVNGDDYDDNDDIDDARNENHKICVVYALNVLSLADLCMLEVSKSALSLFENQSEQDACECLGLPDALADKYLGPKWTRRSYADEDEAIVASFDYVTPVVDYDENFGSDEDVDFDEMENEFDVGDSDDDAVDYV